MSSVNEPNDPRLENALEQIKNEEIAPELIEAAAGRVRDRLAEMKAVSESLLDEDAPSTGATIRGCADFRAMIPDYRAGQLPDARRLLFADHIHECVGCRKALEAAAHETADKVAAFPEQAAEGARSPMWASKPQLRWAVAAVALLAAGLGGWRLWQSWGTSVASSRFVVASIEGTLHEVVDNAVRPVAAGQELPGSTVIRTARESGALVRLSDGSLVEMRERSALSVSAAGSNLTINLRRGSVIVEAAERRAGRLYLATRDCRVAVTGTVFSVNSGVKGSRVAVIEGRVLVAQAGKEQVLRPGEQYLSSKSLTPKSVSEEISWSRNVEEYIALLQELSALREELEQVRLPELRYNSRFLDRLPQETVIFVSFPNLGETITEARSVLERRMAQSPVLQQWWENSTKSSDSDPSLMELVETIGGAGDFLGDEIVVAGLLDSSGESHLHDPVVLSEVRRNGFREFFEGELVKLAGEQAKERVQIVETLEGVVPLEPRRLVVLLRPDLLAMSPDVAAIARVLAVLEGEGASFTGTAFHERLSRAYMEGAGLIFGADFEVLLADGVHEQPLELGNIRHVLVEQKPREGGASTRALFTFNGSRAGLASWLAQPAPLGVLDFISPDAKLVSAFAMKSPAEALAELFGWQEAIHPDFQDDLREAEAELGIDIEHDLAGPLGGEFAWALEGPLLPAPGWKAVAEVYDPVRLQGTISRLVEALNRDLTEAGESPMELSEVVDGGLTYYRLTLPRARPYPELHYVFVDGYMVAASQRALIRQSLQNRAMGHTLVNSPAFQSLLPQDSYTDFSGMMYHRLGAALASLAGELDTENTLRPEQQQAIENLSSESEPQLVTAYGEGDRIILTSNNSVFSMSTGNLLEIGGPLSILRLLQPEL